MMSTEAGKHAVRSPTRAAERMREYRKRHRRGIRCVTIQLYETEIDALVRKRYLADKERSDPDALRWAVGSFISDALRD